ncbi:hypothetical protein HAX54_046524, partial [Datura stramonium]|nr:hypothetical protein [Datura stramonium]
DHSTRHRTNLPKDQLFVGLVRGINFEKCQKSTQNQRGGSYDSLFNNPGWWRWIRECFRGRVGTNEWIQLAIVWTNDL